MPEMLPRFFEFYVLIKAKLSYIKNIEKKCYVRLPTVQAFWLVNNNSKGHILVNIHPNRQFLFDVFVGFPWLRNASKVERVDES